jgi:hypothetical protein
VRDFVLEVEPFAEDKWTGHLPFNLRCRGEDRSV